MTTENRAIIVPDGLKEMLQEFTVCVLKENPSDLLQYASDYFHHKNLLKHLNQKKEKGEEEEEKNESNYEEREQRIEDDEDDENVQQSRTHHSNHNEEDEEMRDMQASPPSFNFKGRSRRVAVAAESFDPEKEDDNYEKVVHPKTPEQRHRLTSAVKNILLFRCLDEDQMEDVIDAMFEVKVTPNEKVIELGQDGDNFYVIESGLYDIYVPVENEIKLVGQYDNKGSFGELALMYNTPRAATIQAVTDGILWAMDRETFRSIVLKKAFQKRCIYEKLLESLPILSQLNSYERMNVADALRTVIYDPGELIINQGDEGKEMYFIEEGSVKILMRKPGGDELQVNSLKKGGYFGELALLTKHPRAASVYATERTKLAVLDVDSFERLLGPCLDIMQRSISDYEEQLKTIFGSTEHLPELRK